MPVPFQKSQDRIGKHRFFKTKAGTQVGLECQFIESPDAEQVREGLQFAGLHIHFQLQSFFGKLLSIMEQIRSSQTSSVN